MSSFLSRFTSSSPTKEKSSSNNGKGLGGTSLIKLPRSSTRNPPSSVLVETKPIPPLNLPPVSLLEDGPSTSTLNPNSPNPTSNSKGPNSIMEQGKEGSSMSGTKTGLSLKNRISTDTFRTSQTWIKVDENDAELSGADSDPKTPNANAPPLDDILENAIEPNQKTNAEELKKLKRAILGVDDLTILFQECGFIIRERGLTTLGLFRPYRIGENQNQIERLGSLFYEYASDRTSVEKGLNQNDVFGVPGKGSKLAKLDRFRAELKYSNVHDVVGVLKWGLRHVVFSTSFAGAPSSTPLSWYDDFLKTSSSAQHPRNAFSKYLLPSLPPSSQRLLTTTLELMQGISAHSELNAMSARRLSRQLGIYVLGLAPRGKTWKDWNELYDQWKSAGEALEGSLRAFVRSQDDLPLRLRELVENYPQPSSKVGEGLKRSMIKLELECRKEDWPRVAVPTINDQKTGLVVVVDEGGKAGGIKRRDPVQILLDAFEATTVVDGAEEQDTEVRRVWKVVVDHKAQVAGDEVSILSDETRRVFGLVTALRPSTTTSSSSNLDTRPRHTRQRSYSHGIGQANGTPNLPTLTPSSAFGSFPNKSTSQVSRPSTADAANSKRIITPSWNDFASSGFGESLPSTELGLVDLSGGASEFPARSKTTGSKGFKAKEIRSSQLRTSPSIVPPPSVPKTTLISMSYTQIEDDFADVWLDTLADPGACSSWPSLVVAELNADITSSIENLSPAPSAKIDHILIAENLIEANALTRSGSNLSVQGMSRSPSIAGSTMSKKWARRASQIFSSSSRSKDRGVEGETNHSSSPRKNRQSVGPATTTIVEQISSDAASNVNNNNDNGGGGGITRSISRTLNNARKKSMTSLRSGSTNEPAPPLPQVYSLESLRAASLSQERPVPKGSTDSAVLASLLAEPKKPIVEEIMESAQTEDKVETTVVTAEDSIATAKMETPAGIKREAETTATTETTKHEVETEIVNTQQPAPIVTALPESEPQIKSAEIEAAHPEPITAVQSEPEPIPEPSTPKQDLRLVEQESPVVPTNATFRNMRYEDEKPLVADPISDPAAVEAPVDETRTQEPTPEVVSKAEPVVEAPTENEKESLEEASASTTDTEATEQMTSPPAVPVPEAPAVASEEEMLANSGERKESQVDAPYDRLPCPDHNEDASRARTVSTASTINPPSPGQSSKRFLGGVGDILRRKTSAEKAQAKADKEEKKETQRELRRLKDEEKARNSSQGKESKLPTPVSSVRKRVLELEAEVKAAEGSPPRASTPGPPGSPSSSPSKIKKSSIPIAAGGGGGASIATIAAEAASVLHHGKKPLPQEPEHLQAKIPASVEQLPSEPLPSPSPATADPSAIAPLATDPTPKSTETAEQEVPAQPVFVASEQYADGQSPKTPTKDSILEANGTPRPHSPSPAMAHPDSEPAESLLAPLPEDAQADTTPKKDHSPVLKQASDHSLAETATSFRTAVSHENSEKSL